VTATAPPVPDLDPDALLRRAHERVHRYPAGFPGFRARVTLLGPEGVSRGALEARPDSRPGLAPEADDAERRWAQEKLGSVLGHRWHLPYERADGRWPKALAPDRGHARGRVVELADPLRSTYRIEDGLIAEISRTDGPTRFTVLIGDRRAAPDGGMVSTHFVVLRWLLEGECLMRADAYADTHVEIGGVLLPAGRRVATATDAGLTVRELVLDGHEVLDPELDR
jgi:hypothetical protein